MFRTFIGSNRLLSPAANSYFSNIKADYIVNHDKFDYSFTSTLRRLFYGRISDESKLLYQVRRYGIGEHSMCGSCVSATFVSKLLGIRRVPEGIGMIYILCVDSGGREINKSIFRTFKDAKSSGIVDGVADMMPIVGLQNVFKQYGMLVDGYASVSGRISVILMEGSKLEHYHALQSGALMFAPWLYQPRGTQKDSGVSEDELRLMKSLLNDTDSEYMELINDFAAAIDVEVSYIEKELLELDRSILNSRIADVNDKILTVRSDIERCLANIAMMRIKERELLYTLCGIENEKRQAEESGRASLFTDYVKSNRDTIHINDIRNNIITLTVAGKLEFFDPAQAECLLNNSKSFVYGSGYSRADDVIAVLKAAFLEYSIKPLSSATFSLNIDEYDVQVHTNDNNTKDCFGRVISQNPHLFYYGCLGGNEELIVDALANGDYISALNLCVCSTQSINWSESTVILRYIRYLNDAFGKEDKCFELPNGIYATMDETLAFVKDGVVPCQG